MSSFSPLDPHLVVGNLITMDPALPRAEAMAIVGGRIVATGTITQMRAFLPTGKILRPDAAAITPGFVDSHLHMLIAGLEMQRLDLDGVGSVAEILKCIAAHAGQSSGAGWLIAAANFHTDELLERRLPTRAELDEVCPDRPLVLDQRTHDAIVIPGHCGLQASTATHRTPSGVTSSGIRAATPPGYWSNGLRPSW